MIRRSKTEDIDPVDIEYTINISESGEYVINLPQCRPLPGKIGTSSPELSYGSHIFQDLVESDILYTAVFENEKTLAFVPEMLKELDNCLTDYYPEGGGTERNCRNLFSGGQREFCISRYEDRTFALSSGECVAV